MLIPGRQHVEISDNPKAEIPDNPRRVLYKELVGICQNWSNEEAELIKMSLPTQALAASQHMLWKYLTELENLEPVVAKKTIIPTLNSINNIETFPDAVHYSSKTSTKRIVCCFAAGISKTSYTKAGHNSGKLAISENI